MSSPTLEEIARILCEPSAQHSEFERAVLLYGLQVGVLSPKMPRLALDARLHAAMRLLEHMESAEGSVDKAPLIKRLNFPDYAKIVDQMLTRDGGWPAIARAWDRKEFADNIDTRSSEARDAGRLVRFSFRFAMLVPGDPRKGGVTMAREVVRKTRGGSDGTIKARWREYGQTAVLAYLMQKMGPRPARLASKTFVKKLLSQVDDIEKLRTLFAAYRDLSKILRPRGYTCAPFNINGISDICPNQQPKPFSPEERKAIADYSDMSRFGAF